MSVQNIFFIDARVENYQAFVSGLLILNIHSHIFLFYLTYINFMA